MLEFLGSIFLVVLFMVFPHTVGAILLGHVLGGIWWIAAGILIVIGLFLDFVKYTLLFTSDINHSNHLNS